MNKKTLKALKDSIKKWKKIIDGTGGDEGSWNCPLCKIFDGSFWLWKRRNRNWRNQKWNLCVGCPVKEKTGLVNCYGSPYDEWVEHHQKSHNWWLPFSVECEVCKEIAIKELEFLKSLLEEGG